MLYGFAPVSNIVKTLEALRLKGGEYWPRAKPESFKAFSILMYTSTSPTQKLANLYFHMLSMSAKLNSGGQYLSIHDLEPDEVRQVKIKGVETKVLELESTQDQSKYVVATIAAKLSECKTVELTFFSKHF